MVNQEILKKLVDAGQIDGWTQITAIVEALARKGYSLKGRQISQLSQLLTKLCQQDVLQREKDSDGGWRYKKIGGSNGK